MRVTYRGNLNKRLWDHSRNYTAASLPPWFLAYHLPVPGHLRTSQSPAYQSPDRPARQRIPISSWRPLSPPSRRSGSNVTKSPTRRNWTMVLRGLRVSRGVGAPPLVARSASPSSRGASDVMRAASGWLIADDLDPEGDEYFMKELVKWDRFNYECKISRGLKHSM
ncbi:hypothetical protein HYPSUDRAFT_967084 [Hypholoma sublateritium FD-334 SS-4]|uniref:Uncharacterized protein n=1 Tax=Hypholoma sublateritium (strain FD-334 SS-4) TaxID=945553 RepID=A0A0D2NNA5_HYPSF|nr:hypothetical protein HYPSUDRAFT_967084 [Hypholoma sublateritium FD-334 SS-4]